MRVVLSHPCGRKKPDPEGAPMGHGAFEANPVSAERFICRGSAIPVDDCYMGNWDASQPPPRERMRATLSTNWRVCKLIAVC